MREKLIELLKSPHKAEQLRQTGVDIGAYQDDCIEAMIADFLLANGVIVPPCKVGDTVFYLNTQYHMALYRNKVYEAKVARIVATSLGVCLVLLIRDESGCCEVPDVRDFGKTVFLSREEAEKALAERSGQ